MIQGKGELMHDHGSGKYHFKFSDREDGSFWIYFEPMTDDIALLKDVVFGIDLKKGITVKEADAIADYLNENLGKVRFRRLGKAV
jgi:hypothetical protein